MEGIGEVDGWKDWTGFDDEKRRFYDWYVCWKEDDVGRYLISNNLTIFLPCTFQ